MAWKELQNWFISLALSEATPTKTTKSVYQSTIEVPRRYPALRAVAYSIEIVGWLAVAASIILVCVACGDHGFIPYPYSQLRYSPEGLWVAGGICVVSVLFLLVCYAVANLMQVAMDNEENTRRTATILQTLAFDVSTKIYESKSEPELKPKLLSRQEIIPSGRI